MGLKETAKNRTLNLRRRICIEITRATRNDVATTTDQQNIRIDARKGSTIAPNNNIYGQPTEDYSS